MASPIVAQSNFRGRNDDVALNSTSFTHALNTNWTQDTDAPFRLRFTVIETNARNSTASREIYYSHNGGAYTKVTTTSGPVKLLASSQSITDDTATSQVISSGTFVAGLFAAAQTTVITIPQTPSQRMTITVDALGRVAGMDYSLSCPAVQ